MISNDNIDKQDANIFKWKLKNPKNIKNSQILLSLTTVLTCKNEWKILMTVSLYSDDWKVRFNEKIKKQLQNNYNDQKLKFNK